MRSHHTQVHGEKLGYISTNCATCGDDIEVHEYAADRSDRHFCSQNCQTRYQREDDSWRPPEYSGKNHPQYESIEVTCGWCGEIVEKQPHQIRKAQRNFCDNDCRAEWQSENLAGENAGQWNGGSPAFYGDNWYDQRKEALQSANYACERCGMGDEEHHSTFNSELHVHHIERIATFDVPENANFQENLEVLCQECHMTEHHK